LENCKKEGIPETELAGFLDGYLTKIQAQKREQAYWEKVREESNAVMPLLSAKEAKERFLITYKQKFGNEFILDEYSEPLVNLLAMYFTNDPRVEEKGISLSKGILLHGGVGTGKSSILSCFTKNQKQSYRMVDCITVASEYSKDGYDSLIPFTSSGTQNRSPREYWQQQILTYCFDDLGVETEKKHFGNEVNVMAEVIQMIYNKRNLIGNIHFTTNLGAEQIKEVYGQRVASRLREMVNVIETHPNSPDRRK
jgi:hypothetical protein